VGSMIIVGLGASDLVIRLGLAFASGIMTYITVNELIPMAHEYGSKSPKHIVSIGILTGMFFGLLVSVILKIG